MISRESYLGPAFLGRYPTPRVIRPKRIRTPDGIQKRIDKTGTVLYFLWCE